MKARLIERIVRPKLEHGIDWSRERQVLIRRGSKELWWLGSGSYAAGDGRHTAKSELRVIETANGYQRDLGRQLGEDGGRLTVDRLFRVLPQIAEFFGYSPSCHELRCLGSSRMRGHLTLLVEEGGAR